MCCALLSPSLSLSHSHTRFLYSLEKQRWQLGITHFTLFLLTVFVSFCFVLLFYFKVITIKISLNVHLVMLSLLLFFFTAIAFVFYFCKNTPLSVFCLLFSSLLNYYHQVSTHFSVRLFHLADERRLFFLL